MLTHAHSEIVKASPGRSSRIRHQNALTERAWKDAVQGLGNVRSSSVHVDAISYVLKPQNFDGCFMSSIYTLFLLWNLTLSSFLWGLRTNLTKKNSSVQNTLKVFFKPNPTSLATFAKYCRGFWSVSRIQSVSIQVGISHDHRSIRCCQHDRYCPWRKERWTWGIAQFIKF